jgi:hypothetical protein
MTILLSNKESLEYFYNALCNGLGYVSSGYGLTLVYDRKWYNEARDMLNDTDRCHEDVLIQILKNGHTIMVNDDEGDERETLTLKKVYERVSQTPLRHLMDMINKNDDAITADVVIQTVIYGEVIFG